MTLYLINIGKRTQRKKFGILKSITLYDVQPYEIQHIPNTDMMLEFRVIKGLEILRIVCTLLD